MQGKTTECCWEVCSEENVMQSQKRGKKCVIPDSRMLSLGLSKIRFLPCIIPDPHSRIVVKIFLPLVIGFISGFSSSNLRLCFVTCFRYLTSQFQFCSTLFINLWSLAIFIVLILAVWWFLLLSLLFACQWLPQAAAAPFEEASV